MQHRGGGRDEPAHVYTFAMLSIAVACATPTRTPAQRCPSRGLSSCATAWEARREARLPAIWRRRRFSTALGHRPSTDSMRQRRQRATGRCRSCSQPGVFRYSVQVAQPARMGTTLVALLWEQAPASSTLWIAHVGDSRCYRLRFRHARPAHRRTIRLVEEQVARRGAQPRASHRLADAQHHHTRRSARSPTVEPEIAACDPQPGDLYLLASDGPQPGSGRSSDCADTRPRGPAL